MLLESVWLKVLKRNRDVIYIYDNIYPFHSSYYFVPYINGIESYGAAAATADDDDDDYAMATEKKSRR